jgi:NAD(P)-dependent dehydrogenase (short-subunit alcohol dehydrogenase family)
MRPPERNAAMVVTGGSSGIGAELCETAARQGWRVWIGYRNGRERAARLATDLRKEGGAASAIHLPLDDLRALGAGIATICSAAPAPRALVLCGGPPPDLISLLKLQPPQLRGQLESAVVGNHHLLSELWRRSFRARGGGDVLAVLTEAQGPPAAPHMASYVTAKYALEGLLHAAAAEWGASGLRIGVVRPGYVETPMLDAFPGLLLERARARAPEKRFLRAREVVAALMAGLGAAGVPGRITELTIGQQPLETKEAS